MKKATLLTAISLGFIFSAFTLIATWKADKEKSTVNFEVVNTDKKGTFSNLESSIDFDAKQLAKSKITASIDVKTIKAENAKLEGHLLSADYFDAEKFPKITFTSTEIKSVNGAYIAKGNLHIKDSTKVIELPFTFTESGSTGVFSGTMTVNCADYGVMKPERAGKDKVLVYLTVPVSK